MTAYKAIVNIRLRPRCALPLPRSRPIGCIACAQNFTDFYLRLPGILNDPFCCMTSLAVESLNDPFCSERGSSGGATAAPNLNGPDKPQKIPLPVGGSAPPYNTWFLGPIRVFVQNGMSIGSVVLAQLTVECPITLQCASTFSPQIIPSVGIWIPSNTWYLRPTRVIIPNGISIGSAVFYGSQIPCCTMHCQWG